MKNFIPYEKLSRRERKAIDARRRVIWGMSPVTRKPPNPKAYDRKKTRRSIEDALSVSFPFEGQRRTPDGELQISVEKPYRI